MSTKSVDLEMPAAPEVKDETPVRVLVDMTQAELDALIGSKKSEAASKAKKDTEDALNAKSAAAAKAADEKNLTDQKEFEKLADTRAAELLALTSTHAVTAGELVAAQARLERADAALVKHLDILKKDIPASVLGLLVKMDAAEQLEWLTEHGASVKPAEDDGTASTPPIIKRGGIPPTPEILARPLKGLSEEERRKRSVSAKSYA